MAPMTRRRSARIASASKIPNGGTPHKTLASVTERDEDAGVMNSPAAAPRTPAGSSPTEPTNSEMHPSKLHSSLVPPSSAARLGFADIPSARRDSARRGTKVDSSVAESAETTAAMLQRTPSKTAAGPPSSSFTFRFTRTGEPKTGDMGLSKEALRMMEELREETKKIRADMEVERAQEQAREEAEGQQLDANGRRIAKPKSRTGRFSDVHLAEFQKMDSIANHPSAFRAAPGRFTPVKTPGAAAAAVATTTAVVSSVKRGLKRTQSKANLDDTPKQANSAVALSAGKKPHMPIAGSNDERKTAASAQKDKTSHSNVPMPAAKRVKQHLHDDASSNRPISRDGSSLPRPTTLAPATASASAGSMPRPQITSSLLTPTKPSLYRTASVKTPTTKTPSGTVHASGLKKLATTSSLHGPANADATKARPTPIVRLVNGQTDGDSKHSGSAVAANTVAKRRALPLPAVPTVPYSKTPAPPRVSKPVLKYPVTTPSRKLTKHVAFTPTTQRAVFSEKSPSLFRSFIPRSGLKLGEEGAAGKHESSDMDERPTASTPVRESPGVRRFRAVLYPDLSKHHLLTGVDVTGDAPATSTDSDAAAATTTTEDVLPSVPGTFTFRSDKTICFGDKPPAGFGASPGQSSVRQVRLSTADGAMPQIPGSFPGGGSSKSIFSGVVATAGPNKENARPVVRNIPHGIANKKRARVSEAEEAAEEEEAERAAKRRRNERVPEGEALMAPRLMGKSGTGSVRSTPQKRLAQAAGEFAAALAKTPMSSAKKRPVLSLSRLNSLARPKLRK